MSDYTKLKEVAFYLLENESLNEIDSRFFKRATKLDNWDNMLVSSLYREVKVYKEKFASLYTYEEIAPNYYDEKNTKLSENKKVIEVSFEIDNREEWLLLKEHIKNITGAKYIKINPHWEIQLNQVSVDILNKYGFTIAPEITKYLAKLNDPKYLAIQEKKYDPERLAKKIHLEEMYPFQKEGLSFLERKGGRGLIGDDMGLGKTVQSLSYIHLHRAVRPVIIICPASIKLNWKLETAQWIEQDSYIVQGRSDDGYSNANIIIINYDIVESHLAKLKKLKPQIIIMDEVHRIKTRTTLRTKAVKKLCVGVPHVIGLSGTPILNKPIELFNILNILDKDTFNNYYRFAQRYCDPKYNGFGIQYNGASNVEELHNLLKETVMIRRKKTDVLKDLPLKSRDLVSMEITNRAEYVRAEEDIIAYIHEQDGLEAAQRASSAEVLVKFNKLKQLAVAGKMKAMTDWIDSFLLTGEKLVIFAVHKVLIATLMEKYGEIAVKIDGSVTMVKRQKAVEEFQNNDKIKLFIGNIQAASEGITLTASSNVVFLELGWTPGSHGQAEDRVHRIGQDFPCTAYYLLANKTIEEEIALLIDEKQKTSDAVLDGVATADTNLLTAIWDKYRDK